MKLTFKSTDATDGISTPDETWKQDIKRDNYPLTLVN